MTANINSISGLSLQLVDNTANVVPLNINLSGVLLPTTNYIYNNFLQVPTTGILLQMPASSSGSAYEAYFRNLGSNNVTVTFTPTAGSPTSIVLVPVTNGFGGIFYLKETQETAGGIYAITLTAATSVTPCETYLGA